MLNSSRVIFSKPNLRIIFVVLFYTHINIIRKLGSENFQTVFTQEPEQAAARFQSSSRLVEGFECEVQSRGFSIIIDEPEMLGGTGKGPNPVEVVLSALGVCQELTYRLFANKMETPITGVSVAVVGSVNLRGFFRCL